MFYIDSTLFRMRQSVQVGKDLRDNPERIDRLNYHNRRDAFKHAFVSLQGVRALKQKDPSVDFRHSTPTGGTPIYVD